MTEDDAEPTFGRAGAGNRQRWPSSGSGRSAGSNSSGSSSGGGGGPSAETVREDAARQKQQQENCSFGIQMGAGEIPIDPQQ